MNLQPVPIVGGCYADDTKPYSSQDCVNWIPERAEVSGGRSSELLRQVPGMTQFTAEDSGDPFWDDCVSLLYFNEAAGTSAPYDEKKGFAWSNTLITATSPIYGAGSLYCSTVTGSSQSTGTPGLYDLFNGDYTLEFEITFEAFRASTGFTDEVYLSEISYGHQIKLYQETTGSGGATKLIGKDANSATKIYSSALSLNTKYHAALVRSGTTVTFYLNGVSQGNITVTPGVSEIAYRQYVERRGDSSRIYRIDNYRSTKAARYTANFTPPSAEYPNYFSSGGDAPSGYVRGLRNVEGGLFAVIGTSLYKISVTGTQTLLGTIAGESRVSMTHNQITGGNELVIVNGSQGYVYNTASNVLEQITDVSYEGGIVAAYLNQYILQIDPTRRYWFHSDLADAKQYISTDRYEGESNPDRMVSLVVDHQEVWVFNERSIDVFVNTGNQSATFERATGTSIEIGCAGTFTPAKCDNSLFWLGSDGIFYRANGYNPMRISTHAIEQAVSELDWSNCYSMVWEDRGHKVIYWSFPDGQTWGYDVATQLWHRRKSYGFSNWRVNNLVYWNGQWIAGDAYSDKLYSLDWDTNTENSAELERIRTTGVTHSNQNRFRVDAVELVVSVGRSALDNADYYMEICYSDDGGYTFSNWKTRSLGVQGAYEQRLMWRRLGMARHRTWKLRVTSPVKCDVIAASASMAA